MSVLRWLLISVLVAMLAVLAGTLIFMADTARSYLGEQQARQSRNAAAVLALALSQQAGRDAGQRQALLSAYFDATDLGYLRYTAADGQVLFERRRGDSPDQASGPPAWFVCLLPLADTVATHRWSEGEQAGDELQLSVHADEARAAFWRGVLKICVLFLAACALTMLFIAWLMSAARRALRRQVQQPIERFGRDLDWNGDDDAWAQAGAAADVLELKPAADAVRAMRARVSATVKERSEKIESLQLELNIDGVTQLANRRYFINALMLHLQAGHQADAHGAVLGHVLLMRQRDLATINQQLTRARTDEWLQGLAGQLLSYVKTYVGDDAVLARLNGSDLALLLPRVSMLEANRHAQALLAVLSSTRIALGEGRWCRWALAMTDYTAADDVPGVLNKLDEALMQSENAGHGEISYLASQGLKRPSSAGQSLWRERIRQGLNRKDFLLDFRCWQGINGRSYYPPRREATLGMLDREENQVLSAYLLMPVAARVGLSGQCDAQALSLGLAWLEAHDGAEIVLRFSLASLVDPEFETRARTLLARHKNAAPRLIVELDAYALSEQAQRDYGGDVVELCRRLHAEFGVRFGLRALTRQIDVLYRLGELACTYIKLGEDFIDLLHGSTGARELLRALMRTARGGGIEVVTMRVSDPEEREWLRREGVGSLQLGECG